MRDISDEPQQSHVQQFEQALATIFTCRSIIKYNSVLTEEQRNELLADIDTTSRFLRDRLVANAAIETKMVLPPFLQAGMPPPDQLQDDDHDSQDDNGEDKNAENDLYTLRALMSMYHTFLSSKQGSAIDTFGARFKDIMDIINEVERIVEKSSGIYPSYTYVEDCLHSIRGFIADLYYSFKEFLYMLSRTLQESNVEVDTEELSSMQRHILEGEARQDIADIAPLVEAYGAHQRLNERRGAVAKRVSDATVFLVFLEENLGSELKKPDEIIVQLDQVTRLLQDLQRLLSDYEGAAFALVRHEKHQ